MVVYSSKETESIMVEKPRQQAGKSRRKDRKLTDLIASTLRKQREQQVESGYNSQSPMSHFFQQGPTF